MSILDDILDHYLEEENPDSPATEAQLSYLDYLLYDARTSPPKQVLQKIAFMRGRLTVQECAGLIELIKGFELEPVYHRKAEIYSIGEKRANLDASFESDFKVVTTSKKKRFCYICNQEIRKGKPLVKFYAQAIGEEKYAHINCEQNPY